MNVDGEPVTSNDVSLKINQILLDDYNLDISFGLEFKNMEIPDNIQAIEFENILIADENNNILYHSDNKDFFDNYVKSNNLNINYIKYSDNYINSSSSNKYNCNNSNNYNLVYNISVNNGTFPKSNSLHIYIENVVLRVKNHNSVINTNWNLTSSLSSSFQIRDTVNYTYVSNDDNNDIVSVIATTYTTGTNIKLEMKVSTDKVDSQKLKELIEKAKNESNEITEYYHGFYMSNTEKDLYDENNRIYNSFNNMYLENSFGEKFYITNNINADSNVYRSLEQDYLLYNCTIDMTTYNCTNEITLHFTYNNEEYAISLVTLS